MGNRAIPKGLRWLLFAVGTGSLVAAGIYVHVAIGSEIHVWKAARALMFFLVGVFCTLMYGENR